MACPYAQTYAEQGFNYVGSEDFSHASNGPYQQMINKLIEQGWTVKFVGFEREEVSNQ